MRMSSRPRRHVGAAEGADPGDGAAGVSDRTVGRIWRTFGLQPHVVESFKISDDPLFLEKVKGIVGLRGPESTRPRRCLVIRRKVLSQAVSVAQPILPMDMGPPERPDAATTSAMARWTSSRCSTSRLGHRSWRKLQEAASVEGFRGICARSTSGWTPTLTVHVIPTSFSAHKSPLVTRLGGPSTRASSCYANLLRLSSTSSSGSLASSPHNEARRHIPHAQQLRHAISGTPTMTEVKPYSSPTNQPEQQILAKLSSSMSSRSLRTV